MSFVSVRSPQHCRRLALEGVGLSRVFKALAPHYGVSVLGNDQWVLALASRLGIELPGLFAHRIRLGDAQATVLIAPGLAFGDPDLFDDLLRLRREATDQGRRTLLIFKRSLKAHARVRLPAALAFQRRYRPGRFRQRQLQFATAGEDAGSPCADQLRDRVRSAESDA